MQSLEASGTLTGAPTSCICKIGILEWGFSGDKHTQPGLDPECSAPSYLKDAIRLSEAFTRKQSRQDQSSLQFEVAYLDA